MNRGDHHGGVLAFFVCVCKSHIDLIPGIKSYQRLAGSGNFHYIVLGLALFAFIITIGV
jgi:hypothetical protein